MLAFGSHMSTAGGGLPKALERAAALELEACQVFTKSERQWAARPLTPEIVEAFHAGLDADKTLDGRVVAHDSYLINVATPDEENWEKSRQALLVELQRCDELRIPYLVSHPGAHLKSGVDAGVARLIEAVNWINDQRPDGKTMLLLETTAGQGTTLGRTFEELAAMIDGIEDKSRVGVCFDTCHVFVAGYDLRTPEVYRETMRRFDETVGLDQIRVFHLNDAKFGFESKKDRHEHIGEGEIGLEGFRNLVNDSRLAGRMAVLETEKDDAGDYDRKNLATLRSLVGTPEAD
ncbi:MAG TPA: deoxyribonuclease IV [Thermomicrobiales bacterium]|jgi:deoxyribonuclease-4|nr:deoxyribonuclease IV [Thermomicrobiales bacterium]